MQSREEWWVAAMEQVDNDKEFLMDISEDLKEEVASHLAKIETALQGTVSFDWYSHQWLQCILLYDFILLFSFRKRGWKASKVQHML